MNIITGIVLSAVLTLNAALCLRIVFTFVRLNPSSGGWMSKLPHLFRSPLVLVKLYNRR